MGEAQPSGKSHQVAHPRGFAPGDGRIRSDRSRHHSPITQSWVAETTAYAPVARRRSRPKSSFSQTAKASNFWNLPPWSRWCNARSAITSLALSSALAW